MREHTSDMMIFLRMCSTVWARNGMAIRQKSASSMKMAIRLLQWACILERIEKQENILKQTSCISGSFKIKKLSSSNSM